MNMMLKRQEAMDDAMVDMPLPARSPAVLRRLDAVSSGGELAPGFTALLDGLRARSARGTAARTLVVAPPTPSASSAFVLDGLAARAEQLGMEVVRGELRGVPSRALAPARRTPPTDRAARHCVALTPRPAQLTAEMDAWLGQHKNADLVLIEAPPLLSSIDGALVARACDGLLLVAERGVTERRALHEAANRARIAGCKVLGVIVTSNEAPMPTWLQRLMGVRAHAGGER